MCAQRRFFSFLALLGFSATTVAFAQLPPGVKIVGMKSMPVTVTAGSYELVDQVIELAPGASIPNHTHGGPVAVTIISGQVTIKDATGSHKLVAGQSATEQKGYVHSATNTGTTPARISASYLLAKGASLLTPAK